MSTSHGNQQMKEEERYEEICKPAFVRIDEHFKLVTKQFEGVDAKLDKITEGLKGDGSPGICGRVRDLERVNKAIIGACVFILCAIAVEVISWLFKVL